MGTCFYKTQVLGARLSYIMFRKYPHGSECSFFYMFMLKDSSFHVRLLLLQKTGFYRHDYHRPCLENIIMVQNVFFPYVYA
jgi:hypothetical protein